MATTQAHGEVGGWRTIDLFRCLTWFPAGLLARIRWIGMALCLVCVTIVVVAVATQPRYAAVQRAGVVVSLGCLVWWWLRGYRRQRFPKGGLLLEAGILAVAIACLGWCPLLNPLGVGAQVFRSLYGRASDLAGLLAGWAVATQLSAVLAIQWQFDTTGMDAQGRLDMASSMFTMALLDGVIFWVARAADRYEIIVGRESTLNRAALLLATAQGREEVRAISLEAVTRLAEAARPLWVDVRMTPDVPPPIPAPRVAGDPPQAPQPAAGRRGRRRGAAGRADGPHRLSEPVTAHEVEYGAVIVVTDRPLLRDVRQPIESLAATCGMALRALDLAEDLRHRAFHDALTGLANRDLFLQRVEQALDRARTDGVPVTLVMIDLDEFKPVNDRYGHSAGDAVLKAVAQRINEQVRAEGIPARLGGDEFAILLEGASASTDPVRFADRLLAVLSEPIPIEPIPIGPVRVTVGASIGVATWLGDRDVDGLISAADAAMYTAKGAGKNRVSLAR